MRRIERQHDDDRKIAESVLIWVAFAHRSLNVEELQQALAIQEDGYDLREEDFLDEEDFTAVCAGLISVEPITKVVRLVHYTTQEFFNKLEKSRFADAQCLMAESCIMYLSLESIERESYDYYKTSAGLPLVLYDYAQRYWANHIVGEPEEKLKDVALQLLHTRASMSLWWWDFIGIYPVHEAAYRNLLTICRELISKEEHDINARTVGGYEYTPLDLACISGHGLLAELLLENGAEIDSADPNGQTALHHAACGGHLNVVQMLLKRQPGLEAQDCNDATPLLLAVGKGKNRDIARALLQAGANPNVMNVSKDTPLCLALHGEHPETLVDLLQHGADVNTTSSGGDTALQRAIRSKKIKHVIVLLEHSADVSIPDEDGDTPLYSAVETGVLELVVRLLEHGADVSARNSNGDTPLHSAVGYGVPDLVVRLLEEGADVNAISARGLSPIYYNFYKEDDSTDRSTIQKALIESNAEFRLYTACRMTSVRLAQEAIYQGCDLNSCDRTYKTGLHHAAETGNLPTINLLLSLGARTDLIDDHGKIALIYAIENNHMGVVRRLLRVGTDTDRTLMEVQGRLALSYAFRAKRAKIISLLVRMLDLETALILPDDGCGRNLLHEATRANWKSIVNKLLKKGADINCKDRMGWTPLHYAAALGSTSMVQLLLSAGASVHSQTLGRFLGGESDSEYEDEFDFRGFTPLHLAILAFVKNKNTRRIRLLINAGCDVNAKLSSGDSPLHFAAAAGFLPVAMQLLIAGADVNEPNNMGTTPLIAAAENGHSRILKLLLDSDVNADACELETRATALHCAVLEELDHAVQILIPSSNLFHLDCEGRSPYDVAKRKGNARIAAFLGLAMKEFRQRRRSYSFPLSNKITHVSRKGSLSSIPRPCRRHSVGSSFGAKKVSQRDLRPCYIEAEREKMKLTRLTQKGTKLRELKRRDDLD